MLQRPLTAGGAPGSGGAGAVQSFQPTTFAERGVIVPFTTPALLGTRLRAVAPAKLAAANLDLVVPNPTGGRGVYLLAWSRIGEFCRPTVHDRRLADALRDGFRTAGLIGPLEVRAAARAVALEGSGGQDAARTAAAAEQAEAVAAEAAALSFLHLLLRQVSPGMRLPEAPAEDRSSQLRQVAQAAAPLLPGRALGEAGHLAAAAAGIGRELVCNGLGATPETGRIALLLQDLAGLAEQWRGWTTDPSDPASRLLALAGSSLALTRLALGPVLASAQALAAAPLTLLQGWAADRARAAALIARPSWLLDGWDRIVARWAVAEDAAEQRAALADFALMLPPLPHEAAAWAETKLDVEAPQALRRGIRLQKSLRYGLDAMDSVARNERLLAAT